MSRTSEPKRALGPGADGEVLANSEAVVAPEHVVVEHEQHEHVTKKKTHEKES